MLFSKFAAFALAAATTVVADKLKRYPGTLEDAGLTPTAASMFNRIVDRYGRTDNFFVTTTQYLTKYATDWDLPFGKPDDYIIYDLRTVYEYKAQHIDGAVNFPVYAGNREEVCRSIAMADRENLPKAFKKAHRKKYVIFHYEGAVNPRGESVAAAYLEYILRNGKAGFWNSLEKQEVVLLLGSFKQVLQTSQRLVNEKQKHLDFDPDLKRTKRDAVSRRWLPTAEW